MYMFILIEIIKALGHDNNLERKDSWCGVMRSVSLRIIEVDAFQSPVATAVVEVREPLYALSPRPCR